MPVVLKLTCGLKDNKVVIGKHIEPEQLKEVLYVLLVYPVL